MIWFTSIRLVLAFLFQFLLEDKQKSSVGEFDRYVFVCVFHPVFSVF